MPKPLRDPGALSDGEVTLVLDRIVEADPQRGRVPTYRFHITRAADGRTVGSIELRVGYTAELVWYAGQIGYGVDEPYRGHRYAARACRLLLPLAVAHDMDVIWITCDPDNWPSRRTCQYAGGELVGVVDLPESSDMYREGERQKCRYRLVLTP